MGTGWWYGGAAVIISACCTHPLDTLKVRMQTSTTPTIFSTIKSLIKNEGIFAFYNGLSASILRQCTYGTARFAVYDTLKGHLSPSNSLFASVSGGFAGGIVGCPFDLINIRMQNDGKLPPELRRNYRNAIDGVFQIIKSEGFSSLFTGLSANVQRGVFLTASQITSYDLIKQYLLKFDNIFKDNLQTHFLTSLSAGLVATTVTSPIDVMKTTIMTHKSKFNSTFEIFSFILKNEGPKAFFKGWVPSFTRLGPHTIITFVVYEQIKEYFG
ncbi:Mitochondrial dicarboxylate transporter [Lobulomyces angularis]|nr:Mitochondrial dicarboxylate transporter [Lobulomyces angularis]